LRSIDVPAHPAPVTIHATPGLLYSAPLLSGDAGPRQTIGMLRALVDQAWKDPVVNRTAIEIIRSAGVAPFDSWSQIHAIYNFARQFYFVNDPVSKEALRPTRELLKLMAGDCDDINGNILPALLGSIGFETRLVTIAADPEAPESFSHVYAEVWCNGQWIPLDAARPGAVFAVAPPHFYRRAWWSLVDDSHGDYPDDSGSSMSGYVRRGVRGLGSITSDLETIFAGATSTLRSISGQTVQPVLNPAIGPGGQSFVTPSPTSSLSLGPGMGELLFLGLAGALIWWGLKD
jgi:hypothetical protein